MIKKSILAGTQSTQAQINKSMHSTPLDYCTTLRLNLESNHVHTFLILVHRPQSRLICSGSCCKLAAIEGGRRWICTGCLLWPCFWCVYWACGWEFCWIKRIWSSLILHELIAVCLGVFVNSASSCYVLQDCILFEFLVIKSQKTYLCAFKNGKILPKFKFIEAF